MTAFAPTLADMEGEYRGVLVSSLGDGGAIALTDDKRTALEALDTYYRVECGFVNLLDDTSRPLTDAYPYLDSGHAVFTRTPDGGWTHTPVAADTEGAVGVTWLTTIDPRPIPAPYSTAPEVALW
ncbi:hypothetical protein ACFYPN_16155 [Streptomyces sp. NPDC005576]|uniref:hypothetical protein n=1 Tax=unclassified Streptomyces TaxID=2593676 RepID=UPI0034010568